MRARPSFFYFQPCKNMVKFKFTNVFCYLRKRNRGMKKFWIRTVTVIAVLFSVLAFGKMNTLAAPLAMPDGTVFDPIFYADNNADFIIADNIKSGNVPILLGAGINLFTDLICFDTD